MEAGTTKRKVSPGFTSLTRSKSSSRTGWNENINILNTSEYNSYLKRVNTKNLPNAKKINQDALVIFTPAH